MPNPLDIKRPLLQEPTLNSPLQTYFAKLDVTLDAAQHKASLALEHLLHLHQSTDSGNRKRRWWKRPQHTGAYLWGEPGRGKTMLLDAMFACLLGEAGTREGTGKRVHYHQFLRELHQKMSQNRGKDYLLTIADELASSCSVFCLDEFHVHDVADVVLLQRFIEALLKRHVLVVLTSNYPPEDLLPDPNKHERALPLIAMLKKHLQVIELDGDRDYRQRNEAPLPHYLSPVDDSTDAQLLDLLDQYGAPVQEWREGVRLLPAGDL
ncbi:MAG: cell division protein ZapE, partial [Oceanobacter sp.]